MPEVSFCKTAHTIPESIGGTKNLICYEECDSCNDEFGKGIEQNLCRWFDFRRSAYGVIKKKGGVAKAYGRNYVIENRRISVFGGSEDDDSVKAIGADTITLQGIYRALCKIAIELIEGRYLDRLQTTIEWIRKGTPKSANYPKIAQMCGLVSVDNPIFYIFTRKDGIDKNNAPLHFCILRIFDMGLLYILPHVDGRMIFNKAYTDDIPTKGLEILGFDKEWIWETYDTTEERNPHVWIGSHASEPSLPINESSVPPIEKLRPEKKPVGWIDFPVPELVDSDFISRDIELIKHKHIEINVYNYIACKIDSEMIFDLCCKTPVYLRLHVKFYDVRNLQEVASVSYSVQVNPHVCFGQLVYSGISSCLNQRLIALILEGTIDNMFRDIKEQYICFPFTERWLNINNVRELLKNMRVFFMKEGTLLKYVRGNEIWHTGY